MVKKIAVCMAAQRLFHGDGLLVYKRLSVSVFFTIMPGDGDLLKLNNCC